MSRFDASALHDRLAALIEGSRLHLGPEAQALLVAYTTALLERNEHVNLTSARTPERAVDILLGPSLGVQAAWPLGVPPRLVVDVGSGNGFPGIAAAVSWPEARVVLVERRAKKARAIQDCANQAGLTQVEALACDAREIKNERPALLGAADLVTLRAVGPLDETTRLAAPLLAPCGRIVHWKSAALSADERRAGAEMARSEALDVLRDVQQPYGDGLLIVMARPESRA